MILRVMGKIRKTEKHFDYRNEKSPLGNQFSKEDNNLSQIEARQKAAMFLVDVTITEKDLRFWHTLQFTNLYALSKFGQSTKFASFLSAYGFEVDYKYGKLRYRNGLCQLMEKTTEPFTDYRMNPTKSVIPVKDFKSVFQKYIKQKTFLEKCTYLMESTVTTNDTWQKIGNQSISAKL